MSVLLTYIIDLRVARLPTCGGRGTRTNISKGKAIVYAVVTLSLHEACEAILPVVASGAFRFEQASEEEIADENQERTGPPAIDSLGLSPALWKPHGPLGVAIGAIARATAAYVIAFVRQDHSGANESRMQ